MFICSIPLLSALISACAPTLPLAVGYVEGEYVLLAPIENARVDDLFVDRGDRVQMGTLLVALERRDAEILVAQARAAHLRAQSELADLQQGARPAEISVAEAAVESAAVEHEEAKRELARVLGLFERNVAPESELDLAKSKADVAAARLRQVEADLAVLRLPARADRIAASEAAVAEAAAALDQAKWRLGERTLTSPASGEIADIYRFPGDVAGPQAPVLSILPDGGIKLRFYVPQASYSQIELGNQLNVSCDGCQQDLQVEVSYLSTEPEFTPPVIYSLDTRQKLVFLAEARFPGSSPFLKPGQIVDVRLPETRE
ncbi:MAG: HlyD family efflux transporter periplasmic adaptor subunit [Pseudomonadota bacterium]